LSIFCVDAVVSKHLLKVTNSPRVLQKAPPPILTKLGELAGIGENFGQKFAAIVDNSLYSSEKELLEKFQSNQHGDDINGILDNLSADQSLIDTLAKMPLQDCSAYIGNFLRTDIGLEPVNAVLAFDVSSHEAANSAPALSVLNRFKEDVQAYATNANTLELTKIAKLLDKDIKLYFEGDPASEIILNEALTIVQLLALKLQQMKDADSRMIQDVVPLMNKVANWISMSEYEEPNMKMAKKKFLLNRLVIF
jgi:hypothetical protein